MYRAAVPDSAGQIVRYVRRGEAALALGTGHRDTLGREDVRYREHFSRQQSSEVRDQVGPRFDPTHDLPRLDLHDCQSEVAWKLPIFGCGDIS